MKRKTIITTIAIVILAMLTTFILVGCDDSDKDMVAYVNYFGEGVKKFEVQYYNTYDSGRIKMTLKDGSHIIVGNNNVIIEEK